jgi:hypothetical protein
MGGGMFRRWRRHDQHVGIERFVKELRKPRSIAKVKEITDARSRSGARRSPASGTPQEEQRAKFQEYKKMQEHPPPR